MKKLISVLLSLICALSVLNSCGTGKGKDNNRSIFNTKKKFEDVITATSGFHEGIALVVSKNQPGKTFGIDKQGYILFEVEKESEDIDFIFYKKGIYCNGLASFGNEIIDKNGKLYSPDDYGIDAFYTCALSEGYLFALKSTVDFQSAKHELGIMNTNFEWIVEPSENLLYEICDSYTSIYTYLNNAIAYDGYCYIPEAGKYIELNTGKVTLSINIDEPSNLWNAVYSSNDAFYNEKQKKMLDLSDKYDNIISIGKFTNGYAAVTFYNDSVVFLGIIDEQGDLLFDPERVNTNSISMSCIRDTSNNYILISSSRYSLTKPEKGYIYDFDGNLISSFDEDIFKNKNFSYNVSISDDIITIEESTSSFTTGRTSEIYFYTPEMQPLF